jgi:hypothetical protein
MNKIDKYFNKLLDYNTVQLSINPKNPITYIMSSGRKFYDDKKPEQREIEIMLQEILKEKIENLPEQKKVEYEIPEKAKFSGIIERSGFKSYSRR